MNMKDTSTELSSVVYKYYMIYYKLHPTQPLDQAALWSLSRTTMYVKSSTRASEASDIKTVRCSAVLPAKRV